MNVALLAQTGADSQIVTVLIVIASVLAGAGVVLLVVRLVVGRRARAAEPTSGDEASSEATAGE